MPTSRPVGELLTRRRPRPPERVATQQLRTRPARDHHPKRGRVKWRGVHHLHEDTGALAWPVCAYGLEFLGVIGELRNSNTTAAARRCPGRAREAAVVVVAVRCRRGAVEKCAQSMRVRVVGFGVRAFPGQNDPDAAVIPARTTRLRRVSLNDRDQAIGFRGHHPEGSPLPHLWRCPSPRRGFERALRQ